MNGSAALEADKIALEVNTQGYSFPVALMSPLKVAELNRLIAGGPSGTTALTTLQKRNPHLLYQAFWDVVTLPSVRAVVGNVLGPDAICFATSIIDKPADRTSHVAWHQDATYWGLAGRRAITIWLALTPSTLENGAVLAVPGRHHQLLDHETCRTPANMLGLNEAMATNPNKAAAVAMTLKPGEASVHDSLTIHGSAPNQADKNRTGFSMRFVCSGPLAEGATLRGIICSPTVGENRIEADLAPAPEQHSEEQAKALHRESVRRLGLHLARSKQEYHQQKAGQSQA